MSSYLLKEGSSVLVEGSSIRIIVNGLGARTIQTPSGILHQAFARLELRDDKSEQIRQVTATVGESLLFQGYQMSFRGSEDAMLVTVTPVE